MKVAVLSVLGVASAYSILERLHSTVDAVRQSASEQWSQVTTKPEPLDQFYADALAAEPIESEWLDIAEGGPAELQWLEEAWTLLPSGVAQAADHGGHGRRPGRGRKNPHDQHDKSIYEFLAGSKYFSTLHDIIAGDPHAVAELNKTAANLTLFAPTNRALERYQEHGPDISTLRKILLYHILPDVFPAGRVLKSKTLETLYTEEDLGQKQRLAVDINLRGLTLNYYARVIYIDIFTNNGVVHAVDNLLFPPPKIYDIAEVLPSAFSTFVNAAWKTGLVETLNATEHSTVFAPSNFGFAKLGPRINAYLFSKRGQPVLTKLVKYHVVPDVLFYSDAVFDKAEDDAFRDVGLVQHYSFATLLGSEARERVSVDVGEWGRFRSIVFNGRRLPTSDLPARNGVLQKLDGVILPYKNSLAHVAVDEMTVEQFAQLFEGDADEGLMVVTDGAQPLVRAQRVRGCRARLERESLNERESFADGQAHEGQDLAQRLGQFVKSSL